ncbi:MAG: hypothetical protein OXG37_09990 [Actinomycetia bacterium]|nr:hypothetical protein [Actinomycetes bacterium]
MAAETWRGPARPRALLAYVRKLAMALTVAAVAWVAAMPLVAAVTVADMGPLWLVSGSLATLLLLGNAAAVVWLWRSRRRSGPSR